MKPLRIYLDNQIISADEKLLHSLSPGIVPGRGVFETMRSYRGKIFAYDLHMRRMKVGLKAVKLRLPVASGRIRELIKKILKENHFKNAQVRVMVWKSGSLLRFAVVARPYKVLSALKYRRGCRVLIYPQKVSVKNRADIKSIRYEFYRKAFEWGLSRKVDEVLILNSRGELCEGSRTNIFLVKDEVLKTPGLSSGCLNGITRRIVLKLAKELGILVKEIVLSVKDFQQADEVFLTNALLEIMPAGRMGNITRALSRAYQKKVAQESR